MQSHWSSSLLDFARFFFVVFLQPPHTRRLCQTGVRWITFFREGLSLSLASTLVPDKNFSIGPVTEREGELGIAAELQCGSTTVLRIEVTSLLAVLISAGTHTAWLPLFSAVLGLMFGKSVTIELLLWRELYASRHIWKSSVCSLSPSHLIEFLCLINSLRSSGSIWSAT